MRRTLDEWCSTYPSSYLPWVVRGSFNINAAWEARGGGWGSTVTDDGWRLFRENLQRAEADLTVAHKLNPRDPEAAAYLITVDMGLSRPREVMEQHYSMSRAAFPFGELARRNKLFYLMPKWQGSKEEFDGFVNSCAAEVPAHPILAKILVVAYREEIASLQGYERRSSRDAAPGASEAETFDKLWAAYEVAAKADPDDIQTHLNVASTAKIMGCPLKMAWAYEQVGDKWWPRTDSDNAASFHRCRAYSHELAGYALLGPLQEPALAEDEYRMALELNPTPSAHGGFARSVWTQICSGGDAAAVDLVRLHAQVAARGGQSGVSALLEEVERVTRQSPNQ